MKGKKAQFYLIAAVVLIALALGFVAISNSLKKESFQNLDEPKEEIEIEAQNVLNYAIYNDLDSAETEELFLNFAEIYSNYSVAENIYFLFGNSSDLIVTAYRRESPLTIYVDVGQGNEEMNVYLNEFKYEEYSPSTNNIKIIISEVEHNFELEKGKNFYYLISEESKGEEYIFTGGVINGKEQ
jgi:hypothetical protein